MGSDRSTAIAPRDDVSLASPMDGVALVKWQFDQLRELQKQVMRQGADYGVIPGTSKPTLYKPGAEKILKLYRFVLGPTEIISEVRDLDTPFVSFTVRVVIVNQHGERVGDGIGECNNFERRYLRIGCGQRGGGHRHVPECYQRHTPATYDYAGVNTVLKMARKRALVDAALVTTMASDLFTQDVEDLADTDTPETSAIQAKRDHVLAAQKTREVGTDRMREIMTELFAEKAWGALTADELDQFASRVLDEPKPGEEPPATETKPPSTPLAIAYREAAGAEWQPADADLEITGIDSIDEAVELRTKLLTEASEFVDAFSWGADDVEQLTGVADAELAIIPLADLIVAIDALDAQANAEKTEAKT